MAEGIENKEELEKLINLGVDMGQGFFLAKPNFPPVSISSEAIQILSVKKQSPKDLQINEINSISEITQTSVIINPDTLVREVHQIFENNPNIEGLPVCSDSIPCGLIMRDKLFHKLSTQHGFALYYNRAIKNIMNSQPLIVDNTV